MIIGEVPSGLVQTPGGTHASRDLTYLRTGNRFRSLITTDLRLETVVSYFALLISRIILFVFGYTQHLS